MTGSLSKEDFIVGLDRSQAVLGGLPVTRAVTAHLSAQLKKGEPAWWKAVLCAWEGRRFVAWTEAWSLLVACLHFEALNDADNPLVPYFPSCGGTDEADPTPGLAKFLGGAFAASKTFAENLASGQRRSYLPARAPLWMAPAALYFQTRELPYYLVEVNAGAGLHLAADLLFPARGFESDLVAARVGLDAAPLELEDILHRRWLTAGVFPDHREAIAALDQAVEFALERLRREPRFIQLAPCPPETAARFIAKNIPPEGPEVGLLVLNTATTSRMTDEEYKVYSAGLSEVLKAWNERALWVEVENVRGELHSTTHQLRVHRMVGGEVRSCVMASIDHDAAKTSYARESESFLSSGAPGGRRGVLPLRFPGF